MWLLADPELVSEGVAFRLPVKGNIQYQNRGFCGRCRVAR